MNVNQTKFTNPTWNLDISMEYQDQNQILHDQVPFNSLLQSNYAPLQAPQTSSSLPNSTFLGEDDDEPEEELGAMKEMMYKIAAMQPVDIDPASIRKPKRRNVRISEDPQSVAARNRREKISEKIRILQRLVPGGTKMDTASMLDEAIRYVKFLKRQIRLLQSNPNPPCIADWQAVYSNKHLGSTHPSSIDDALATGPGLITFGASGKDR